MSSREPYDVEVDHLAYLTERRHRRAVHAAFRRASRKGVSRALVEHERDRSCCEVETWAATTRRIQAALQADGLRVGWTFVDRRGAEIVAPRKGAA